MNGALVGCVLGLVLSAVAQQPGVVSGVVKDARSGAVLPRYLLELHGGSRFDRVTSDAEGKFASSVPFGPGEIDVRLVDDDAIERKLMQGGLQVAQLPDGDVKLKFEGKPLDVAVAVGPTIQLRWKAADVEGTPTTPATSSAEIVWAGDAKLDPEVSLRAGVRIEGDGRSWVRFAPLPEGRAVVNARLRVVSVDGLWKAEAPIADGGADVEWKKCARWVGVIKGGDGHGVGGPWLRLERLDEKGAVAERRRTRCDPSGKYAFEALDAGMWRLSGDPMRFRPFTSEVREVAGGVVSKLTIDLDAEREFQPINGRIEGGPVVDGQAAPGEPSIVVRRGGDPLPQETLRAAWRAENGRYVAMFIVPKLPMGEYELELVPAPGDAGKWSALTMRAKAGSSVIFTQR